MLVKHRLGHLIPMQVRIRDVPPGEAGAGSSEAAFTVMALLRPISDVPISTEVNAPRVYAEDFIVIDSSGRVRGASIGAFALFCATPAELTKRNVLLSEIIPGWAASAHLASSPSGVVVNILVCIYVRVANVSHVIRMILLVFFL